MYTAKQAIKTLDDYMGILDSQKNIIEGTKNRGYVISLPSGDRAVIFVYPLVHKKDNTKNYFDTRDSGASERNIAWQYSINNKLKYFCFGVNDQVGKYKDYIFSLECNENIISKISGTKDGQRNSSSTGNQIIIPNNYVPSLDYERIKNNMGVYMSVVKKHVLFEYMKIYDNRPYSYENSYLVENNEFHESEINEETAPYNGKTAENIIYYGAPGTGKSYGVSEYVNDHICEKQEKYDASKDDCKYVFRATLHPEYTYSDFVGQVMPVVEKNGDEKSITYDFKPGVFTEALTYAEKHPDEAVFLVLEELSRANVAAVFGDVFQLLDRNDNGRSEYGIDNALIANAVYGDEKRKVFIPGNLFIIGTVNTSDQNVFAMDTAFKRRFNWKYVSIDVPEEKKAEFNQDNNPEFMVDGIKTDWLKFYTELDKFITSELGMTEDKQIGPYFIKFRKKNNEYDEPREIIRDKLLQYLWDDVQGVARNMYAEKTLFLKKFTSYSMLYDAFDKGESVFSNEFISRLGKSGKVAADDEASDQND